MPNSRPPAGRSLTRKPSIIISPEVGSSSPANSLSAVDLPNPGTQQNEKLARRNVEGQIRYSGLSTRKMLCYRLKRD